VASDGGLSPDPSGVRPIEDITTLTVVREIPVPADPVALAFGAGSVWVASMGNGTLSRIDPTSGTVTGSVELGGALGYGALAESAVGLAQMGDGSLSRFDPETLEAETLSLGPARIDHTGLRWAPASSGWRIRPLTRSPGSIRLEWRSSTRSTYGRPQRRTRTSLRRALPSMAMRCG